MKDVKNIFDYFRDFNLFVIDTLSSTQFSFLLPQKRIFKTRCVE